GVKDDVSPPSGLRETAPPVAEPQLHMEAAPPIAPLQLPAMHTFDAEVLPEHALIAEREPTPEREPIPERELIEASFHHEIRGGDLLCGRYRVVDILRRREWMTLAEAVDEPKAGMPGIRQRVSLQVL